MEDDEEKDRGNKCLKETVTESFNNYQASRLQYVGCLIQGGPAISDK